MSNRTGAGGQKPRKDHAQLDHAYTLSDKGRTGCTVCANRRHATYVHTPNGKLVALQSHLRRKYGLTLTQYAEMVAVQGGVCAICGVSASLEVDHDHGAGKVRGLLCANCNRMLGMSHDNPDVLRAAIEYLEEACQTPNG